MGLDLVVGARDGRARLVEVVLPRRDDPGAIAVTMMSANRIVYAEGMVNRDFRETSPSPPVTATPPSSAVCTSLAMIGLLSG